MPTVSVTVPRDAVGNIASTVVEALRPYEVPCIERFEETAMLEAFEAWRDDAVTE